MQRVLLPRSCCAARERGGELLEAIGKMPEELHLRVRISTSSQSR